MYEAESRLSKAKKESAKTPAGSPPPEALTDDDKKSKKQLVDELAALRQRIRDLAPGGGYVVASANSVPEYVPLANYNAMRAAVLKYGGYPIRA